MPWSFQLYTNPPSPNQHSGGVVRGLSRLTRSRDRVARSPAQHNNSNTHADWNGADWSRCWGRELYTHEAHPVPLGDFDCESENLADRPEHRELVTRLSEELHSGWQAQMPAAGGADE